MSHRCFFTLRFQSNSERGEGTRLSVQRSLSRGGGGEQHTDAAPPEDVTKAECIKALRNAGREETALINHSLYSI